MTHPRWPRYVAAFAGFFWFVEIGGFPTLNPRNVEVVLSGDWMQHWFGWLMFRREAWTFPLGTLTAMPYPIGTTIGFTDSNPLVSLLLKPFSGWLPAEFQFIGPWLAFCFVMQGYMGAALTSTVTKDAGQQALGGFLFVFSPVLVARMGHDTLCAHWLLLGVLYLGLRDCTDERRASRSAWLMTGAAMLAASIHPYLAAMCWVLAQAGFIRLWRARALTLRRSLISAVATTAGVVLMFGVLGYFGEAQIASTGFGVFSSDLLTLIDPAGFSRILPRMRLAQGQWEGVGFLGLGGMLALAAALIASVRARPSLRGGVWVIVLACVLMGIYALSFDVTLAGQYVAGARWFYAQFATITAAFRASGRFIWALHYLVLLFGIWGVTRLFRSSRQSAGTALLTIAVVMQATDLKMDSLWAGPKYFRQVPMEDFAPAVGHYQHLAIFPMQVLGVCGTYNENYVYRYMLHAYRVKMTFNSGVFARLPVPAVAAECARMEAEVKAGTLDPQTIYIVELPRVPDFKAAGAACGRVDGDWVCVSRDSDQVFRTFLETGRLIERTGK